MTRDNPFDFNNASEPYRCLGDATGVAVEDAANDIAGAADEFERGLAALRGARRVFSQIAKRFASTPEATMALMDIMEALSDTEGVVHKARPPLRGRPPSDQTYLARQAQAVFAVEWLQNLRKEPLDRGAALLAVATHLAGGGRPVAEYRAREEIPTIEGWLDTFSRTNRNDNQRRALANVRNSVWEQFFRTWREPVRELPSGEIEYSTEWHEHDYLDMTSAAVIEWLRKDISYQNN